MSAERLGVPDEQSVGPTAGQLLRGSLYASYYDIDFERVLAIDDVRKSTYGRAMTSPLFDELCRSRAGADGHGVAVNGKIIEQQQILTTQNLAVLFAALDLGQTLGPRLPELAHNTLAWILKRHQVPPRTHHAKLVVLKNTAYAWRQMVFFLALCPPRTQHGFLESAKGLLAEKTDALFQARFRPALVGLERAMNGEPPEGGGGRVFLGWTTGAHWLAQPTG